MTRHRRPPARKVSKQPPAHNLTYGVIIKRLYANAVELEALAITADEAATTLPPTSSVKRNRLYARIATLAKLTADQASDALERAEELVSLHAANLRDQTAKRS